MPQRIDLRERPEEATDEQILRKHVARQTKTDPTDIHTIIIRRRSIDARQRQVYVNLGLEVYSGSESPVEDDFSDLIYPSVEGKTAVIVVGAGPAGLFAALRLIELGLRPIILERGKSVHERRADIARIPKEGHVDPESNYGFGEGGAGAFSDGKLYTRSNQNTTYSLQTRSTAFYPDRCASTYRHRSATQSDRKHSAPNIGSRRRSSLQLPNGKPDHT